MCRFKAVPNDNGNGQIDIECECEISGKPITVSNEYGMFCEDLCELDENKEAYDMLHGAFDFDADLDESLSDEERTLRMLENLISTFTKPKGPE